MKTKSKNIAILGGGNIGVSLARGLVKSGRYKAGQITITRRNLKMLDALKKDGFIVTDDNNKAVRDSGIVVLSTLPQQLNSVLGVIKKNIDPKRHLLVSVVSGANIRDMKREIGKEVKIIRAMPNTAIAIGESMTCIAHDNAPKADVDEVRGIFETVGITVEINEELMTSATALCACGIAFFLRAIRAASQGGTEIGFHSEEALKMAAQTAKGAASLLLAHESHPEGEIDKVTSPKGCTIAGLNEMEHQGFSSALIKGIKLSSVKAGELYKTSN